MDRGQDRDDWFAGTETDEGQAPASAEANHAVEDWLQPPEPAPPRPWPARIDRRVFVVVAVAIALVLAVLAAFGAFSSGAKTPVPAVTSTSTVGSQTTQVTTAPQTQAVPAPSGSLKPGDTGAQVKVLQRALTSLGFSTGKIDGFYGAKTKAAVKRFQRSAKLKADGIVGPKTLSALATALRGS